MVSILKRAGLSVALAATALVSAVPAEAHDRYWRRGNDVAGPAIAAGVLGLAVGAAVASSNRPRRDVYYDGYYDGYYDRGYHNRGYYDRGYYDRDYYYDRGYYAPRGYYYGYRGYRDCFTDRRWDPYYGRWVVTRICR